MDDILPEIAVCGTKLFFCTNPLVGASTYFHRGNVPFKSYRIYFTIACLWIKIFSLLLDQFHFVNVILYTFLLILRDRFGKFVFIAWNTNALNLKFLYAFLIPFSIGFITEFLEGLGREQTG